ncbi:MAG: transporter substrate-binding domain-containing protein [Pseudomonadota bacterium]
MNCLVSFKSILLISVMCFCFAAAANEKRRVVIGTGDGRPFIYTQSGSVLETNPGLSIEILQAVANEHNWSLTFIEMPFARQVSATRSGSIDGMVATFIEDAPDFHYPAEPIAMAQNCFFAKADSSFYYDTPASLDKSVFGVTNGYHYGEIDDYILENRLNNIVKVSGEDKASLATLFRLLEVGRIDAFIEANLVVRHSIASKELDNIKKAGCTAPMYAYVAFSPDNPSSTALANNVDSTIKRLRASGELDIILRKYGVDDWK